MAEQDTTDAFANAQTLTVSEVYLELQDHVEAERAKGSDYQPNLLLAKTLDYANQFATSRNKEALKSLRK